jgi:hypothetical protein
MDVVAVKNDKMRGQAFIIFKASGMAAVPAPRATP